MGREAHTLSYLDLVLGLPGPFNLFRRAEIPDFSSPKGGGIFIVFYCGGVSFSFKKQSHHSQM